jgi:DNA-binding CsgD family transcriptional regulator
MLSNAETQVLDRLRRGLSNQQIADELFVSEKAIKFHLTNIYRKLGATNRLDAIRISGGIIGAGNIDYLDPRKPAIEHEVVPQEESFLSIGAKPIDHEGVVKMQQGARQVQVVQKSQEDKITFIDDKFKVGDTITQLHTMMKDVTSKELTPATVNAACNCVARLNETINTAISAARFLNER